MSRDKKEWTDKTFRRNRSMVLLRDKARCFECSKASKASSAFVPNKTKQWKGKEIPVKRTVYVVPLEEDLTRELKDFELHRLITLCHRCYWNQQNRE